LWNGNILWKDGKPVMIDWQFFHLGNGLTDLIHFIVSSVSVEILKDGKDEDIIQMYYEAMKACGVSQIGEFSDLLQDYQILRKYGAIFFICSSDIWCEMKDEEGIQERIVFALECLRS